MSIFRIKKVLRIIQISSSFCCTWERNHFEHCIQSWLLFCRLRKRVWISPKRCISWIKSVLTRFRWLRRGIQRRFQRPSSSYPFTTWILLHVNFYLAYISIRCFLYSSSFEQQLSLEVFQKQALIYRGEGRSSNVECCDFIWLCKYQNKHFEITYFLFSLLS